MKALPVSRLNTSTYNFIRKLNFTSSRFFLDKTHFSKKQKSSKSHYGNKQKSKIKAVQATGGYQQNEYKSNKGRRRGSGYINPDEEKIIERVMNDGINERTIELEPGDCVKIEVTGFSRLGVDVRVLPNGPDGLIFSEENYIELFRGQVIDEAWVTKVRENLGSVDISLRQYGFPKLLDAKKIILRELTQNEGFLALTDKSCPEVIKARLMISKSNFKSAVGMLMKSSHVALAPGEGIYLTSARSSILQKLKPEARDKDEKDWRSKVNTAALASKNQHHIRAPPVIPGSAGIDRHRLKNHQKQALEKRNRLLDIDDGNMEPRKPKEKYAQNHRTVKRIDGK